MADWRFEFEKVVRRGGEKDKQSRIRGSVPAGMGAQVEKAREGTESIADLGSVGVWEQERCVCVCCLSGGKI